MKIIVVYLNINWHILEQGLTMLADHPIGGKMEDLQSFKYWTISFYQESWEYAVLQDRWSVTVVVSQNRFHCIMCMCMMPVHTIVIIIMVHVINLQCVGITGYLIYILYSCCMFLTLTLLLKYRL